MAKNKKSANPELTVAELKELVFPFLDEIFDKLSRLDHKVKVGGRKTKGLQAQVTSLHTKANRLKKTLDNIDPNTDNRFTEASDRATLEGLLDSRLFELNSSIDTKFEEVNERLDAIEAEQSSQKTVLDGHEAKLISQQAQIDGATVVGNVNSVDIRNIKTEIGITNPVRPWAIVAGIAVAVLVGWILWLQPVIVTQGSADDGITETQISWIGFQQVGSWLIGAAAGLIVAWLIDTFAKRSTRKNTTVTTSVPAAPRHVQREVNNPSAGYPGTGTAPTKVMKTAGAGSGAQ